MSDRDAQTVVLSRPTVLLVTGVGVGLLTLTYVLGVQIGKQSAALRPGLAREEGAESMLSLDEQLKQFDHQEVDKALKAPDPLKEAKPQESKPEATEKPADKVEAKSDLWTLQLLATSDEGEAKRVAAKAKAAGFKTTIVQEKKQFKLRLADSGPRADMDARAAKLKAKGLASFAVKAE
ncbi:MAG: SPOR domain-containing protein [Firmicutes bacterium]|nr:SPOR domain-containing protein [Bacillota bacterium]